MFRLNQKRQNKFNMIFNIDQELQRRQQLEIQMSEERLAKINAYRKEVLTKANAELNKEKQLYSIKE